MRPKMIGKITVDLGMTILLMLLMAFELIGRTAHVESVVLMSRVSNEPCRTADKLCP